MDKNAVKWLRMFAIMLFVFSGILLYIVYQNRVLLARMEDTRIEVSRIYRNIKK